MLLKTKSEINFNIISTKLKGTEKNNKNCVKLNVGLFLWPVLSMMKNVIQVIGIFITTINIIIMHPGSVYHLQICWEWQIILSLGDRKVKGKCESKVQIKDEQLRREQELWWQNFTFNITRQWWNLQVNMMTLTYIFE